MPRFINGWIILFSMVSSYGQESTLKPLNIGEQLPSSYLSNASYYSNAKYKNNSSKPKLIILDFWGVHCTSCIREMPDIEEYQNRFADTIQVYLVTSDTKEELDVLYKKTRLFRDVKLPIIYGDTALSQLFPWDGYGLNVWLDSNGKVAKKTQSLSYTIADVQKFIADKMVDLVERNDKKDFNRNEWIASEGGGRQQKNIQYYSVITSRLPDHAGSGSISNLDPFSGKITAIRLFNQSLPILLSIAFGERGNRPIFRTIYKTTDSSRYFPTRGETVTKWNLEHCYSYELRIPGDKSKDFFKYMQSDLERFFNLRASIKNIKMPVLELCRSGKWESVKTKGGPESGRSPELDDSLILANAPISVFTEALSPLLGLPTFDKTGIDTNIDISVTDPHGSIDNMNRQLANYGLKLTKKKRKLPVLIVEDVE